MKIALMSDLHLSVQPMVAPHIDADVLVLAGDLHRPAGAIAWARQFGATPTLFVAGNHEFYGADLIGTMHALRTQAEGSSVRVLEQDVWYHQGVRFLGCTLWSDYRLFDSAEQREQGLQQAAAMVRDFSRIRVAADFDDLFTPAVAQLLFDRSVAWLERQLAARQHRHPVCRLAAERLLCLGPAGTDRTLAARLVAAWPCARQLRLPDRPHAGRRQSARLCAQGRSRKPALRSIAGDRAGLTPAPTPGRCLCIRRHPGTGHWATPSSRIWPKP